MIPADADVRGFAELTAANEFDLVRHSAEIASMHGDGLKALVKRTQHRLSAGARRAWSHPISPG